MRVRVSKEGTLKPARIVVAVVAVLFALVSVGMIVGGVAVAWAFGTQRDADGFLTSPTFELESGSYAITSEDVDLASRPGDWFPSGLADVRIDVAADDSVFVGIGPSADVDAYLSGVAIDEVTRLGPADTDVEYRTVAGSAIPVTVPAAQDFWVESSEGSAAGFMWEVDAGEWTVVVMNADASPSVAVSLDAGVRIPILFGIGIGLLIGGLFLGMASAAALVWATRRAPDDVVGMVPPAPVAGYGHYPVALTGQLDPNLSRGMWLVKWILAIPHYVVLAFLWIAFMLLTIVAGFSILFTGRYPRGIFDFNVGVLRWGWRVSFYAFSAIGTDQYPPFTLQDVDYPARFDVAYPERLSQGLVLVKWWLLAIPHYLIVGLFTSGLIWWASDLGDGDMVLQIGGGLIGLLVLIAGFALLFTGRYPQGLFDLVMGLNRWAYRVTAYAGLMRDEYPPFRLDLGGDEPGTWRPGDPVTPSGGTTRSFTMDLPSMSTTSISIPLTTKRSPIRGTYPRRSSTRPATVE